VPYSGQNNIDTGLGYTTIYSVVLGLGLNSQQWPDTETYSV